VAVDLPRLVLVLSIGRRVISSFFLTLVTNHLQFVSQADNVWFTPVHLSLSSVAAQFIGYTMSLSSAT